MNLLAFTVYDSKAEAYLPPLFYQSKGLAVRAFQEAANDPQSNISKYPSDFTMFEIGSFDQGSASLRMYESKVSLGSANEYLKGQSN